MQWKLVSEMTCFTARQKGQPYVRTDLQTPAWEVQNEKGIHSGDAVLFLPRAIVETEQIEDHRPQ